MHKLLPSAVLALGLALISPTFSLAGPLTEAHVTKIVNQVKLVDPASGDRDAKLDDVVQGDLALTTGIKSRSELVFQDNTLTRLGPESYFSFKSGTRDMTLQRGTLLLQVPKNLGGAKIHTAAVTAAITGTTIMMEYVPQKEIKVLVLEGSLRLSMNGRFGDSLLLTPGKMVIMPPNAKRIPDPVTVDLKKIVQTSTLVNMESRKDKLANANTPPIPSMSLIEKEIDVQQSNKDGHRLADTNLVILGKGTNVVLGSDDLMKDLTQRTDVAKNNVISVVANVAPTPVPVSTPVPTPNPAPTPNANPPPVGAPPAPPAVGYTIDNTTVINSPNGVAPTIVTQGVTTSGVHYTNLLTNGSPSAFLFGAASAFDNELNFDNNYSSNFQNSSVFEFDSLKLAGGITFNAGAGDTTVTLLGNNGITNGAGTIDLGGINSILFATKTGSITLDPTISFTTSVENPKVVQFYARGGDINSGASFNLAKSDLQFDAENNAIFTGGTITSNNLEVTGLQTIQFDANATIGKLFQLNGGNVELGGSVTANTAYIYGSSATINGTLNTPSLTADVTGDFIESNSGSLVVPVGGPGSATTNITAGGNVTLDGTVTANKLSIGAGNALTVNNSVTSSDALNATAASATINGTLNDKQATFQMTGTFLLGSSSSLTTTGGDVQINAGAITVDGIISSAHNLSLTASGAIVIDHSMTASNQILITGGSVAFNTDFSGPLSGPNATELTATSGDINAGGHTLSGFDQILLNSGNFTVGTLTSTKTVSVAGTLAGNSIAADTITANALQVDSLTANKTLTVNTANLAPYATNTISINAPTLNLVAGANLNGTNGTPSLLPGNAMNLAISTNNFTLAAPINLNGGDGDPSQNDLGGNGGQLDLTSNGGAGGLTINAPISATTGLNSKNGNDGGNGGTVNLNSSNTITLNNKIEVSSNGVSNARRRSASGGHINIKSTATGGTAINVSSSAQLLALLNAAAPGPGGSIKFTSAGGAINMSGTVQADRGTIEVTNNGALNGQINLTNATLLADTIKVGALSPNGTLNIGGGSISADTMLKLYAGGSNGTIDFTDNVTLGGNGAKIIAANTVIINNGKIVTVLGPSAADVFTNHANYTGFGGNGTTTGTFAGKGAITHPLNAAPGY